MNILLVAVNAKYIHSNPAIYSLQSACSNRQVVTLAEYTINHQREKVLADIYKRKPDVIALSCYIWNISFIEPLIEDLALLLPNVPIWLGGPEVSYDAKDVLARLPMVKGVMVGEGEHTFDRLVAYYFEGNAIAEGQNVSAEADRICEETELVKAGNVSEGIDNLKSIEGIVWRDGDTIYDNGWPKLSDLGQLPFYYEQLPKEQFENRIVYYESSRGCPFSCSYCLSSIDKSVRFRDIDLVKKELQFFLDRKVPQVKFIDRTFNCDKKRAKELWLFMKEHANGITNFHFEVSADLLDEESIDILCALPKGLVQLEIGVQTTKEDTLKEIRRKTDMNKLFSSVKRLIAAKTVHCHLDLIAGLPFEDYKSFKKSFNDVYSLHPHQLQLGFLKVLKGSYMEEKAKEYSLKYSKTPPYEVLSTNWISYEQLVKLKGVEEMVELYSNTSQFTLSLPILIECFASPFAFFEALADYYREKELLTISHSRVKRYEILREFYIEVQNGCFETDGRYIGNQGCSKDLVPKDDEIKDVLTIEKFTQLLVLDLYAREHVKSRPAWAPNMDAYKSRIHSFYKEEAQSFTYLKGYEDYDSQQLKRMTHLEPVGEGVGILFDYKTRDSITYNARMVKVQRCFLEE